MNKKLLGSTDVGLSPLALGTVKFGRNQSVKYPGQFNLPADTDLKNLLSLARDYGVSTLDTAPAYGISEERLGKLMQGQRNAFEIISKAGEIYDTAADSSTYRFDAKTLRHSLETSLRTLKTDYLDVWLLHSDGNDLDNLNDETLEVFLTAKQQGYVRAIGMSTKTVDGGRKALEHMDCIMMAASLSHEDEAPLFDIAASLNKGLLMKKIFDSGWALTNDNKSQVMEQTYNTLFSHQAVCSAIVGTINPKHLIENTQAFEQAMPLGNTDAQ
ncbi:D-threo-aldose 1-dehydrogenase [BD1-7 clade bacterium]|uniref:D-threo-aldose 1-dehydrogenase n=1 Tax=BD1-7 clade bacterium TaxID=2029982 RepID=A0A5S9NMD5_9GAMM|nr:D-threo-aldose 1-dehydrogenase [BD1-7 clade bacterium]CAA0093757.1 D-threo-aldose 1-dehydrogenase [BD1-7 clade bacterium]